MAGAGLSYLLLRKQMSRREQEHRRLLKAYVSEQERLDAAASELLIFLVEIINAAARSGESEYMLAKRLNLILTSRRGEGRTLRDVFTRLADFCCGGFITRLGTDCPDLSPSEKAVCSMMVIGLEAGTISKVCGFEHEQTFYNKRKDIRRKIGLDHSAQLEVYLQEWIDRLKDDRSRRIGELLR